MNLPYNCISIFITRRYVHGLLYISSFLGEIGGDCGEGGGGVEAVEFGSLSPQLICSNLQKLL